MSRVGIFGGSFNPIHLGHTALAAYICEQGFVDEVWMMVSPQNPLKQNMELLDENQRLHMVELAVAPYPGLKACDFEFHLKRPSYTYHTLQALRTAHPDCEFSLIIGEDNWQNFHRWYRGEDIARETSIIVYPRDVESLGLRVEGKLRDIYPTGWFRQEGSSPSAPKLLPYSSTEVRQRIAAGQDTSHMLHPDVNTYIQHHHLYTTNQL